MKWLINFFLKLLKRFKRAIKDFYLNIDSSLKMYKNKRLRFNDSQPIVFICQNQAIWSRTKPVVGEIIKKNSNVILLVVEDTVIQTNETTVFEKDFPSLCVKYESNILNTLKPQIVIYSRPYSHHLPKDIRIEKVCNFSKTAYIPYYYSTSRLVLDGFDKNFQKYLNFNFADQKIVADYFNNIYFKKSKGNQIAFNLGYPSLEKKNLSMIVNRKELMNKKVIVRTPRWTSDPKLGGTNFFNYVDLMLEYFLDNPHYIFIFRPHPLLFSNFISTGELSKEKKEYILTKIHMSSNSYYDDGSTYKPTLNYCDVLICDTSGIILDFATLGKMIIFCDNPLNDGPKNLKIMDDIKNANYVANSFDDIINYLNFSVKEDEKNLARRELSDKLLSENDFASTKICNQLLQLVKQKHN